MRTVTKVVAFLVFILAIGGATYAVQLSLGGPQAGAASALRVDAPRTLLNATAGHSVTYPLVVSDRGSTAEDVTVTVTGAPLVGESPVTTRVASGANATVFATVAVPASAAPGTYPLAVHVRSASGAARDAIDLLELRVLGPTSVGFDTSSSVNVLYTGRLASNGQVFNTNDPAVLPLHFNKFSQYVPSTGELQLIGSDPNQVVEGFYHGVLGIQAGESRTLEIPAAQAYGDATDKSTTNRTETFQRTFDLPKRVETVARATFDAYMNDTDQKGPFTTGSSFFFIQAPNKWPYKIASIDASSVGYVIDVQKGESYTLFPFWTNATKVVDVNDTRVEFYTTPTTAPGQMFTVRAYWPEKSTILSETNDTVIVQHSPGVGFKFTQPATQFQQAREMVVSAQDDTTITLESPSTNPLAGKDLVFDVLATEVTR